MSPPKKRGGRRPNSPWGQPKRKTDVQRQEVRRERRTGATKRFPGVDIDEMHRA